MSQQREQKSKGREKDTIVVPPKQRALVFQGGGALGAYEAGVYRVLHDWIYKNLTAANKKENFFVVSHVLRNKREAEKRRRPDSNEAGNLPEYWYGSAYVLEDFWNSLPIKNNFFVDWYGSLFWP